MGSNVLEGCIVRLDTIRMRSNVLGLEAGIVRLDTMDEIQCTRRLYSKIKYSGWDPMY